MKAVVHDRHLAQSTAAPQLASHEHDELEPPILRKALPGAPTTSQLTDAHEGGTGFFEAINTGLIQRDGHGDIASNASSLVHRASNGSSHGLPGDLRSTFEQSLGVDLGGVRIHSDGPAAAASESLGARAFALGQDVYMGAGSYDPHSPAGQTLLAHEIAHTVQQRGAATGPQTKLEVSTPGDAMESAADSAADAMVAGRPVPVGLLAVSSGIARKIHRDTGPARAPAQPPPITQRVQTDSVAMARDLRRVLESHLRELNSGEVRPENERVGTARIAEEHDAGRQDRIRFEAARLQSQISQLLSVRNDPAGAAVVADIARANEIHLERRTFRTHDTTASTNNDTFNTSGYTRVRGSRTTTEAQSLNPTHRSTEQRTTEQSRTTNVSHRGITSTATDSSSTQRGDGTGESTSSSRTHSATFSNGTGTLSSGSSQTHSETNHDGSSSETTSGTTNSVAIGSNAATFSRGNTSSETHRDSAGDPAYTPDNAPRSSSTSSTSTTASGGIVYGQDGRGVSGGFTRTNETARNQARAEGTFRGPDTRVAESTRTTTSANAQITDHGASATGSAERRETHGPASVTQRISANASYRVDISPVDGEPGQYEVVTTIRYGGTVGATGGLSRGSNSISGGVDVTGSRSSTYRHRMTRAEADTYLDHARAAGRGIHSTAAPEFTFMQRLHAAGDHSQGVTDDAVLSNPAAARSLSNGSSFEQTSTLGETVRGSVTAGTPLVGGGVSGSAGGTHTRTVRVAHRTVNGRDIVEIRLTFSDGRTTDASAHATIEGVSIQGGQATANDHGRTITVPLDTASPTYDADFRRVMDTTDQAGAEAIAAQYGAAITRSENQSVTNSVGVGQRGTSGIDTGITGASTHARGSTVAYGAVEDPNTGRRSIDATHTGSSTQTGALRVGGTDILTTSSSSSAQSHVQNNGTQTLDVTDRDASAVPVLPQFLQDALHTSSTRLEELHFNEHDVDVLASRAHNPSGWGSIASNEVRLHAMSEWVELGNRLRNPHPNPDWVRANPAVANRIARGNAVADFISSTDAGVGTRALLAVARGQGGERLGRHIAWPENISGRGPVFHQLETRVQGAPALYATFQGADRADRIRADVLNIRTQLYATLSAVQECNTFPDSDTKVETLNAVREQITRIERIERDTLGAATATTTQPAAAASEDTARAERERNEQILNQSINTADAYKAEEDRHWRASQAIVAGRGYFSNPNDIVNQATSELEAIARTYPQWVEALRNGYRAATAAQLDPYRLRRSHPNANWSTDLLREIVNVGGTSANMINIDSVSARWHRAARVEE